MSQLLDDDVPFRRSALWRRQHAQCRDLGPRAWSEAGVPSYLTSHPLTARAYSTLLRAFSPDLTIDLGAGTGRLAYLILQEYPHPYLLTDISPSTLAYWHSHPYLQPFLREGMLRTALWPECVLPPCHSVALIANYFFDTIPQSLYKVERGILYEGYVTTTEEKGHFTCRYHYRPTRSEDPFLLHYSNQLQEGVFLYPDEGIRIIESIPHDGPLLLLCCDQAVTTEKQARAFVEPVISHHGTFSMTVSYHCLAAYFRWKGGTVWTEENPAERWSVLTGLLGGSSAAIDHAFRSTLGRYHAYTYFCETEDHPGDLLELLEKGRGDPINMHGFYDDFRRYIAAHSEKRERLLAVVDLTRIHFFPISQDEWHFLINLGVLYHELHEPKKALAAFHEARRHLGDLPLLMQNIHLTTKQTRNTDC